MTAPDETRVSALWMGIRFAALLLAHGGYVSTDQLRRLANESGVRGSERPGVGRTGSNGSKVNGVVRRQMNDLVKEGLVRRTEDGYEAVDLIELADYVAVGVEDWEERP